MKLEFIVNDYLLAWHLLFRASFNEEIQSIKMRLYNNHKEEYLKLNSDINLMLEDIDNFIPNNDLIYDSIMESDAFKKIKKDVEEYYLFMLKSYDKNKRKLDTEIYNILRIHLKNNYKVIVLHPEMDMLEYKEINNNNYILIGKPKASSETGFILNLVSLCTEAILNIDNEKKAVEKAVLDLAINNELKLRLDEEASYNTGDIMNGAKVLYPYFLMYLGADDVESLVALMMRNRLGFEAEKYQMEPQLKKINIKAFIDFCYNNWNHLVK